jgi:hypothetical protein
MLAGKLVRVALCVAMLMTAALSASASAAEVKFSKAEKFTVAGKAGTLKTMPGGNTVECKEVNGAGELTDTMTFAKTKLTFSGCSALVGGLKFACTNIEAKLKGKTGWISETGVPPETSEGAILETEGAEELFAKFECAGQKISVKGPGIIGQITPKATLTKEFKVDFKFAPTLSETRLQKFESIDVRLGLAVKEKIHLSSSVNGGAAEPSAVQLAEPAILKTTTNAITLEP